MEKVQNKLVSIIVPIYNTEKYLKECIESLINQTYKNLEIILVDDGSTDNSRFICDEYKNKIENIKVIHQENQGISNARNKGLEVAQGYYISFVDSDDYVEETMIEKLVRSIEENEADMSICNYYPNKENKLKEVLTVDEVMELIIDKRYFRGYVCNKLYKKELLDKLKFEEDIKMCEDFLFNCKYLLKCSKCSYVSERLYFYRANIQSISNSKFSSKYLTILTAYDKIKKIYEENYEKSLKYLYIDIFKICCDIIYRNSLNNDKEKLQIEEVYKKREEIFEILKKSKEIKKLKKMELFIYYKMPITVGKLRKIKYKVEKRDAK